MPTTKELVERILREDPRARDDDLYLTWRVWRELSPVFIPFKDFSRLPRPETISRWRRYFQNQLGLYVGRRQEERMEREHQQHRFWAEVGGDAH